MNLNVASPVSLYDLNLNLFNGGTSSRLSVLNNASDIFDTDDSHFATVFTRVVLIQLC